MRLLFRSRLVRFCLAASLTMFGMQFYTPDEAEARNSFRISPRVTSLRKAGSGPRVKMGSAKPRFKTYTLGHQKIQGYRNYLKARREAKLASGGYRLRSDGRVVPRDFHIPIGRVSMKPLNLPRPAGPKPGTVQGQCVNGATITTGNVHWACREMGGVSWSQNPARLNGVRDY